MKLVFSVIFAMLAAMSNAFGTVFQRRAAVTVPQSNGLRIGLMWDLLRTPVWLGGIICVILAAALQATALATGPLAIVQPIFVLELPCTLLISGVVFSRPMNRHGWIAVTAVVVGLGIALGAAAPGRGVGQPPFDLWILALASCGGTVVVLCLAGLRTPPGRRRAALFGLATAITYSLTAALMKSATDTFAHRGAVAFFTHWQTYAFAVCGATGLFLLENAMQAGPLVGSQPALTLGDALVSLSLGVVLYNETVRTGWWLLPELIGLGLIAAGVHGLSSSDILTSAHPVPQQRGAEPRVANDLSLAQDMPANNDGEQNSCAR
jgi:drug/metabolite transporter (DMT)-like permease